MEQSPHLYGWTQLPYTHATGHESIQILDNARNYTIKIHPLNGKLEDQPIVKAMADLVTASPYMMKALEGVLHHNDGVKEAHKLPNSLIREIVAAIAKAKGYPADGVRGDVLPIN